MAAYYLETSALVKRYVQEQGTKWIQQLLDTTSPLALFTSEVTAVEIAAAIYRRVRMGDIGKEEGEQIVALLLQEFPVRYRVVQLGWAIVEGSVRLAGKFGLRGYDAIQLSSALRLRSWLERVGLELVFVCADQDLNEAAQAEGLGIEDPTNYS